MKRIRNILPPENWKRFRGRGTLSKGDPEGLIRFKKNKKQS